MLVVLAWHMQCNYQRRNLLPLGCVICHYAMYLGISVVVVDFDVVVIVGQHQQRQQYSFGRWSLVILIDAVKSNIIYCIL